MVRQRIPRNIERKRRGKLKPLPKRLKPLLIVVGLAIVLMVLLNQQAKGSALASLQAGGASSAQSR